MKTVSVIVPTKNSQATLEACLQSIRSQTYSQIELIVADNVHTTDKTGEIAKKYAHIYIKDAGNERSQQRNFAMKKAKGTYLCFIDSDMTLDKNVIKECVELMEGNSDASGVVIPEESFGQGFWAQCKKFERSFYIGIDWLSAARFMKRETCIKLGGFDRKLISAEDWDLHRRLKSQGTILWSKKSIYHNEGHPTLFSIVRKKAYYAEQFVHFERKTNNSSEKHSTIIKRYILFFSHPVKLLRHPVLTTGMLLMKTLEFLVGMLAYFSATIHLRNEHS